MISDQLDWNTSWLLKFGGHPCYCWHFWQSFLLILYIFFYLSRPDNNICLLLSSLSRTWTLHRFQVVILSCKMEVGRPDKCMSLDVFPRQPLRIVWQPICLRRASLSDSILKTGGTLWTLLCRARKFKISGYQLSAVFSNYFLTKKNLG